MKYIIKAPNIIDANIVLPASKSISNRALVISAMANANAKAAISLPQNLSDCDDTDVIISALRNMPEVIDIKAAGTAMRFMTAYLAICDGESHIITGTERMCHRPIKTLVDALRQLGADIEYLGEEGYPPLRITGKQLRGGRLGVSGSISSQYISAILMIAPMFDDGLILTLSGEIVSRPYIDLTLSVMRHYGADVEWIGVDTIKVAQKKYSAEAFFVESDWSAASYWYEMMALYCNSGCKIMLEGLMDGSYQGDSQVRYMFSLLGVSTSFSTDCKLMPATVLLESKEIEIPRMDFDFTHQPDLAQTLIATCLAQGLHFHFRGLASLKIKETDRIEAMKREMRRLGFVLHDYNDSELRWDGERCEPEPNAVLQTYDDHRMAMAMAPMCIILGPLTINDPMVVTKSYPHFWEDLKKVGFEIIEV